MDARTRKRSLLALWLAGEGIEIGALNRPLPVTHRAHVTYVDHLPDDILRKHYPEYAGEPLVKVDVLGDAQHLEAFPTASLDFVVANHLVEHLEDPVAGLQEMFRVLRPGGIFYAAVPDARVTFDKRRQRTTVKHVLEEHTGSGVAHRRDHYVDWVRNVEDPGGRVAKTPPSETETLVDELVSMRYSIHFHVWDADGFLDLLFEIRRKGLLDFELLAFAPPAFEGDDELIVVLGKGRSLRPRRIPASWRDYLDLAAPPRHARLTYALQRMEARIGETRLGSAARPWYRALKRRLARQKPREP